MSFTAAEQAAIDVWTAGAKPLSGVWFRSVPARSMDPAEVLNGGGTALHGGRFAPPGTLAVFLSATDQLATAEVTMRKSRLGGSALISVDKYPRIVFGIEVSLERVLDLNDLRANWNLVVVMKLVEGTQIIFRRPACSALDVGETSVKILCEKQPIQFDIWNLTSKGEFRLDPDSV